MKGVVLRIVVFVLGVVSFGNMYCETAEYYQNLAKEKKSAEELYNLGVSSYNAKDYNKGVYWCRKAAELGHAKAQCCLGWCYANGKGVSQDYNQAVYWYKKAGEQGDSTAQKNLGNMYYNGEGVSQDYSQAVYWYKKNAEHGSANVQAILGWCYYNGKGVPKDYTQAVYWYRKAAEQGNANAQSDLGWCYMWGNGVTRDYNQAQYWYRKAAEQGNPNAQYRLGGLYTLKKDDKEAFYWYKKSAEQGLAVAQHAIGHHYENGLGVSQDYSLAVHWYRKAAEQGYTASQYWLGWCYENARGVSQDYHKALEYYNKSKNENKNAKIAYERVFNLLNKKTEKTPITTISDNNTHNHIDLGLPSGTLWATCNIGASTPEQYGDYYSWGETETKITYGRNNAKWYFIDNSVLQQKGVIDFKGNLTPEYDVASVKWGKQWRMPTSDEIKELVENCKSETATINGVTGRKLIGKNGNSIFLPFSGDRDFEELLSTGKIGLYWSSTVERTVNAYRLVVNSDDAFENSLWKHSGLPVRPVRWNKSVSTPETVKQKQEQTKPSPSQENTPSSKLHIYENSISFQDANGNFAIDANEKATISFKITNIGKTAVKNCKVLVSASGSTAGISFSDRTIPMIGTGSVMTVKIPVAGSADVEDGSVKFDIVVKESSGTMTETVSTIIATQGASEPPYIQVTDYSVTGQQGSTICRRSSFDLELFVSNLGYGDGEKVSVGLELPNGVSNLGADRDEFIGGLRSGESERIVYSLAIGNNFEGDVLPIKVVLREKYGKYADGYTINLKVGQRLNKNTVLAQQKIEKTKREVANKLFGSDRTLDDDAYIPQTAEKNTDTYAIIIANENYNGNASDVPYATNDGGVFQKYCIKTLGIPKENAVLMSDCTYKPMSKIAGIVKRLAEQRNGDARFIIYYAGHGCVGRDNETYLLPTDGSEREAEQDGISLKGLYRELATANAKSIVVFLDACHTGAKTSGARGGSSLLVQPTQSNPQGNVVVFSASSFGEEAMPYDEVGHGRFTYFLLKKLQESKGNCTLGELSDYIKNSLSPLTVEAIMSGVKQTPAFQASPKVRDMWKGWRMK